MMSTLPVLGHTWPFPAGDSRGWPFPSVNGEQTEASKALQSMPAPKPLTPYQQAVSDPDIEECLL